MRAQRSWARCLILHSRLIWWNFHSIVIRVLLEFKLSLIASDRKWRLIWFFIIAFLCRPEESITASDQEISHWAFLLTALSQLSSKGLTASSRTRFTPNRRMFLLKLHRALSRGYCEIGNLHGRVIAVQHDWSLEGVRLLLCLTTNPHYSFPVRIVGSCRSCAIQDIWNHIGLFISDSSLIIVSKNWLSVIHIFEYVR